MVRYCAQAAYDLAGSNTCQASLICIDPLKSGTGRVTSRRTGGLQASKVSTHHHAAILMPSR